MPIDNFRLLNAIGLILVNAVLGAAFYGQFVGGELPCPLCLLQRVAFVAVLYGLVLNVVYGAKPLHYSIILVSALLAPQLPCGKYYCTSSLARHLMARPFWVITITHGHLSSFRW